jgi:DNA-directed RNA polymerase subunit RPC12/RpoP
MTNSATDSEHDACPNCGSRVESAISAPGEPLREATERRCPNCGKVLRREVGGAWTVQSPDALQVEEWEDEGGTSH